MTGSGSLTKALDLSSPTDSIQTGSGNFAAFSFDLLWGTGGSQANQWWHDQRSVAASANDDLDLAGGLTSPFGETITFTKVKWLWISIVDPDGIKKLQVGPQNVTNGWAAPWGGAGATVYETITTGKLLLEPYAGYTVTAGTADILRINNPSAVQVDYNIWIGGLA